MRSGSDAEFTVKELLESIQEPLTDKREFPVIAMCALVASENARRKANNKPPLNCKVIDLTQDDAPFYTAQFINSLRTTNASGDYLEHESMRAIIKNGAHYFVVAFEFSPAGNKFVVLDAAGDPRGDYCYKKLGSIGNPDQNNAPYFSECTLSTGSKYEDSDYDLNSWCIQKSSIDCPAFSLEHAFQLSKMPNFFNDVKKHAFEENYINKVGWLHLAKKLVRGAQSERWLQTYLKLHPDSEISTNPNSIVSIFQKHQTRTAEFIAKMLDEHSAEYVLSSLLAPVLIKPANTENIIAYESSYASERDNIAQNLDNLHELKEIFSRLSPDDIRTAMKEFKAICDSIDAMSSLKFSLLNGLNESQMNAVCESLLYKFSDPQSDLINSAFDFNVAMSHLSEPHKNQLYAILEPKIATFDFSDPEDFMDVVKHTPTEKLPELCKIFGIDRLKQYLDTDKFADLSAKARYTIRNMIAPAGAANMQGMLFSHNISRGEQADTTPKPPRMDNK